MPMILFIFSICLIFIFEKLIRKLFIIFFSLFFQKYLHQFNKSNTEVKINFKNFYNQVYGISKIY